MTREEAIEFLNVMWETLFQEMRTRTFNELEEQGLCDKFKEAHDMAIQALEQDTVPFDFDLYEAGLMYMPEEIIEVLDKIKSEIKEWYWQADKRALAKDPCVVDAMIDLFIRTIDKYMKENKVK